MTKDRKKIAVEWHHKNQERNEYPMIFGKKVPVIKDVYDPLTGLRDGTITIFAWNNLLGAFSRLR